ncbi:hypothetical protein KCTC32516_01101 [Polaribacter huanghezhanensis]|uniref:hypothetical protein n=1 Tax=Polaribacter huanghezhanensis TaxID=1354726 RepID=UPI002649D0F3|nr:hypothetical protein [Polaribacter huanghezhanensis]WKD85755.1 hypothetical protein KCTC32516_01101 [Polaribacter huanghezhanensis]
MKKQILNLGKALSKLEQKKINGGGGPGCTADVHYSQCNDADSGTVFYPYYINGVPTDYGDCCIYQI